MFDVLNWQEEAGEPAGRAELMAALTRIMALPEAQLVAIHVLRRLGIGRIIQVSETEVTGRNLGIDILGYIMQACPGAGLNILAAIYAPLQTGGK